MQFLHDGRPPTVRQAVYSPRPARPITARATDYTADLKQILASLNVASKEWVIRQYDHEVQAGSVIKPLVGCTNDGPSDAAVIRPRLESRRGVVIACGMNPCYGDFDTYHMAASGIDEAIRNCVAVGADRARIAILDNFCWGNTDRPEMLGSLTRAALACRDMALKFGTPFISGKDSLKNEFVDRENDQRIAIPPTLLISAMGQIDVIDQAITMDLKQVGSRLFQIGRTADEMGGSHWCRLHGESEGFVPQVDAERARNRYDRLHQAIKAGLVAACHDMSEGGLAVCLAEMAFAGMIGVDVDLSGIPCPDTGQADLVRLFAESNSRFLCEVSTDNVAAFRSIMGDEDVLEIGSTTETDFLSIRSGDQQIIQAELGELKSCWQRPLAW